MDSGVEARQWGHLQQLCDAIFARRRLVLVSNRGPVEHQLTPEGRTEPRRGSGGVVTSLNPLTQMLDFTWIASAMGEGDRRVAEDNHGARFRSPLPGHQIHLRYVATPRRVYHKYYNIFCNPLLWFLQHYMWNSPYNPNIDATIHDAWSDGYVPVNEAFAQAVAEEGREESQPLIVMGHDYHLYLTPGFVRKSLPGGIIQHFVHIPWPSPRYWSLLPSYMRQGICQGLCSADLVGFQTSGDMRNFLDSCEEFLPQAVVNHNERSIACNGRLTRVRVYPISINVEEIRRIASSPRAMEYERRIRATLGPKTIVRVDRAEPSKNVVRGFRAFGLLLSRYPELKSQVNFLAFLVPSRTHIRQYQRYMEEIQHVVQEINTTFGTPEWQPVKVFLENNYVQAIAGMKLYDVLLVNSVIDGMNLVAKEGPVVNTKDGVLVLSDSTGAHKQLCHGALSVSPTDVEGTMQALYQGLTMSAEEKKRRAEGLVQSVEREDISHWLCRQIEDLAELL